MDAIAAALLDLDDTGDVWLGLDQLSGMVVHRAAGMGMEPLSTSIEEALTRLRATAYARVCPSRSSPAT